MRYLIIIIGVLFMISSESCRRGEDDPLISLRSRTNRLTGKWKLVKLERTNSTIEEQVLTNDVNLNTIESEINESTSIKVVDNFYEEKTTRQGEIFNLSYSWKIEGSDTILTVDTTLVEPDIETTIGNEYSFNIEISKDDRFKITKKITASREYFIDATKTDGISDPLVIDTSYTNQPELEQIEEGIWYWQDAHKKNVILNAGEVHGYVRELRNDKLVITSYSSSEQNNQVSLEFRNDLVPFDDVSDFGTFESGTERTVKNFSQTTETLWEFEKLE